MRRSDLSLREKIGSKQLASYTRSSVFIFPYFALLTLVNIYGTTLSPRDIIFRRFYYFWHSHDGSIGLLTAIMATNCLVAVYLWLEFRIYRYGPHRNRTVPYLYFVCCAFLLMLVQHYYLRISAAEPGYTALLYDLRTPVAIPVR